MTRDAMLDFYRQPGPMTSAGKHSVVLHSLPEGVAELARIIQGRMLHEHWAPYYGQILSEERRIQSHIRPAESMLDRALAGGAPPLTAGQPLEARIVGTCRNFSVLMVAFLRAKGIPARARCGFGTYFNKGTFEDHWVAEYWNDAEERWIMVDAQIDEFQRERQTLDFDVLDVPRDRFIVAGDAWAQCRAGQADPATFGIMAMRGLLFIAGNVVRDLAALNNMEMLPWDTWGLMPAPEDEISDDMLEFVDRLAEVSRKAATHFSTLRELYIDDRLRVPDTVFDALLSRAEAVW